VVVGAIPFEGTSPAILTIPRVAVVRRADGAAWRITVEPAAGSNGHATAGTGGEPSIDLRERRSAQADGREGAQSVPSPDGYQRMVAEARDHIRAGDAEKIVLARTLVVRGDAPFDRGALLRRLLTEEPDAYTFAVRRFVGASPELLVSRFGDVVAANPLGGTARRSDDKDEDAEIARTLLASEKDLREHALAADAVVADLSPVCSTLDVNGPGTRATATLWHLSTELSGRLAEPAPSALELAALLHPMPAVCGTPTATALELIDRLETFDRKLYGGLVGWMDADGDGEWALALRCAELDGETATLFAGAGIVADSDPAAELAETDAKFGSMLRALEA
jgi:isochorismate synthase